MGKYEEKAAKIGVLVESKNKAYGCAFDRAGEILQILFPYGIRPDQYTDMLGIVRVLDKMFRLATYKDGFGESPWQDIAGYGLLGAVRDDEMRVKEPEKATSIAEGVYVDPSVFLQSEAQSDEVDYDASATNGQKPF